jgi:hypothetical protein
MAQPRGFARSIYEKQEDFIGQEQKQRAFEAGMRPKPEKEKELKEAKRYAPYAGHAGVYLKMYNKVLDTGNEIGSTYGEDKQNLALKYGAQDRAGEAFSKYSADYYKSVEEAQDFLNKHRGELTDEEEYEIMEYMGSLDEMNKADVEWSPQYNDFLLNGQLIDEAFPLKRFTQPDVIDLAGYGDLDKVTNSFTKEDINGITKGSTVGVEDKVRNQARASLIYGKRNVSDLVREWVRREYPEVASDKIEKFIEDQGQDKLYRELEDWKTNDWMSRISSRYSETREKQDKGGFGFGWADKVNARPIDGKENSNMHIPNRRGVTLPTDKYTYPIRANVLKDIKDEKGKSVFSDKEEAKSYIDRLWVDGKGGLHADVRVVRKSGTDLIKNDVKLDENDQEQIASTLGIPKDKSLKDFIEAVNEGGSSEGSVKNNDKPNTYNIDGETYTKEELIEAGWTEEQINQL